jgi:cell division protein ZapA
MKDAEEDIREPREVSLEIAGQTIKILSNDDEAYLHALAANVDARMRQVGSNQLGITTLTLALTAALLIADELHQIKAGQSEIDEVLDRLSGRIEDGLAALQA